MDFATDIKALTPDEAASNLVYAAFDPDVTGKNFISITSPFPLSYTCISFDINYF